MIMKKILFILTLIFIWVNFAYAEEKEIDYIISPEFSWIEQYYKSNLTDQEKEEIKKIYENLENKKLYCLTHWGYSGNWCWSSLRDWLNELYSNLKKYITIENQSNYMNYILKNSEIKDLWNYRYLIDLEKKYKTIENKEIKEKIIKTIKNENKTENLNKTILSEKQKESIINKLKNFNEEKLNLLNNKIDTLLNSNLAENKKSILIELKEIIKNLNNDNFINDLLN